MDSITLFFVMAFAAEVIITAIQLIFTRKELKNSVRLGLAAGKLLLAIVFGLLVLAGPTALRPVQLEMTALYAVMLPEAVIQLVFAIVTAVTKKKPPFGLVKAVCFVGVIAFVVTGMINSQRITPDYHTCSSDKINHRHTFVYLADLHYGGAQREKYVKLAIDEIKKLDPDFILLGGDITDDFTAEEQVEDLYGYIADGYDKPIYFTYGNHDRPLNTKNYDGKYLKKVLDKNGIIILDDKFVCISEDLEILGREDMSEKDKRLDTDKLKNAIPDHYLVIADHQPGGIKENLSLKPDLQLSGHTHAGQLFPLRVFYDLFISKSCGEKQYDDTLLYVSPGFSCWRFPFRTEASCHYEVFTLTPEK
ncbi:MAG: metallophosphoesterase [Clostridia bacterium]|nr:metallophosphoesterase [Clostridia bacterium]